MGDKITLLGLDFGTTTSSAVAAHARLVRSAVTGRVELCDVRESFRSEMAFTPLDERDRLDLPRVESQLDAWLRESGAQPEQIFGGGALLTGLTAKTENAARLVELIRRRLGNALVATADDPCLEAWLAFMGSCAALSRTRPERAILNLDIGGGTTNLALGIDGDVLRTGCLFLGARHVRLTPGTYRILHLSRFARDVFSELGIARRPGDSLPNEELHRCLDHAVTLLEAAASGATAPLASPAARQLVQVPLRPHDALPGAAITFSGGVGELIYQHVEGKPWPETTRFGDLGIDLAQRIVGSPLLSRDLASYRPASAGRATVYGLLRHATEVSGSTLFLPRPELLPLADVPIVGRLDPTSDDERLHHALDLAQRGSRGGCVQIELGAHDAAAVRTMGERLAAALRKSPPPAGRPLVLLVRENVGKVLGHYVTGWGTQPIDLVVIDEVPARDAQYVQIGAPRHQSVPVSFYGLNPAGPIPAEARSGDSP